MRQNAQKGMDMIKQSSYLVPCIYDKIVINCGSAPLAVSVPGSKSITNRALLRAPFSPTIPAIF